MSSTETRDAAPAADTETSKQPKQERRRIRWIIRGGVLLVLILGLKLVGLDAKFYYPNDNVYLRPEDLNMVYEDVYFTTADNVQLHGWFLPAHQTPARGLVVHFHGNAGNVTAHLGLVNWLPLQGYHVLMFDYRGYGKSAGRVTRAGTIRDGHAAIDYALARPEAENLPLFAYGQSLGGAVAITVAADRREIAAVVAESTFSSYRRIAALHARSLVGLDPLARLLAWATISAGHDPIDVVSQLAPRPLLVIAAADDTICFPELARELYSAAGDPKDYWLAPDVGHLEIVQGQSAELARRVTKFFEQAGAE